MPLGVRGASAQSASGSLQVSAQLVRLDMQFEALEGAVSLIGAWRAGDTSPGPRGALFTVQAERRQARSPSSCCSGVLSTDEPSTLLTAPPDQLPVQLRRPDTLRISIVYPAN